MPESIAAVLHGLAATVWVGGMFFAYLVLRPSLAALETDARFLLWVAIFSRFFFWVWISVLLLLLSGYWLVFRSFGGFSTSPLYVHIMHLAGLFMFSLFAFLFVRPWSALKQCVQEKQWMSAGHALNVIRRIVLINLITGLVLISIVYAGRHGLLYGS
ncbi:MAG: CopD family protein [Granulosicoccus sp.]